MDIWYSCQRKGYSTITVGYIVSKIELHCRPVAPHIHKIQEKEQ
jgi:hypothetical protein